MTDIKRHNTMVELENCSLNIKKLKEQLEAEIKREKKIKEIKFELKIDDYLTIIKKQIEYKKVCLLNQQFYQYYMAHHDLKCDPRHRVGIRPDLGNPMYLVTNYCKKLDNYTEFYREYNKRMSKYVFNDIFKIIPTDNDSIKNSKKIRYKEYFIKHLGPYQKEEAIYKSLKIINERLNKIEEKLGI